MNLPDCAAAGQIIRRSKLLQYLQHFLSYTPQRRSQTRGLRWLRVSSAKTTVGLVFYLGVLAIAMIIAMDRATSCDRGTKRSANEYQHVTYKHMMYTTRQGILRSPPRLRRNHPSIPINVPKTDRGERQSSTDDFSVNQLVPHRVGNTPTSTLAVTHSLTSSFFRNLNSARCPGHFESRALPEAFSPFPDGVCSSAVGVSALSSTESRPEGAWLRPAARVSILDVSIVSRVKYESTWKCCV